MEFQQINRPVMQEHSDNSVAVEALMRFRSLTLIGVVFDALIILAGIVTLVVASSDIGFPVFNFGPLLVGLAMLIPHANGLYKVRTVSTVLVISPNTLIQIKHSVMTVFIFSVIGIVLAVVSAIVAVLAGLLCVGVDMKFYTDDSSGYRKVVDLSQHCLPHKHINSAMGFIDFVLCIVISAWCIFGMVYLCIYGKYIGFMSKPKPRQQMDSSRRPFL